MSAESAPQGTNAIIVSGEHVLTIPDKIYGMRFPGGTLDNDLDANLEHCCSREVFEETGVVVAANGLARIMSYYSVTKPVRPGHSPEFTDHYLFGSALLHDRTNLLGLAQWLHSDTLIDALGHPIDRAAFELARLVKSSRT